YVIYTSGTTGKPKGVMVRHLGMVNHIYAKIRDLDITSGDIIAQTASIGFDISVWQFLTPLLTGARAVIIDKETRLEPSRFMTQLNERNITIWESVPSLISTFLQALPPNLHRLPRLRWMILTGEALRFDLVKKWFGLYPDIPIVNAYGPTEASDDISHHFIRTFPDETESVIPIGSPLQNTCIYILDHHLKLCPIGVKGEIYVAGPGVGPGYWRSPEKTALSFIPNPHVEDNKQLHYNRLYRTGDLGRWLENG
ncbi:MAG: amino acid adenylation domain-containing protein, partial [bacterium]|nr:amino acid adenylation domain-containing protein [bacterium]